MKLLYIISSLISIGSMASNLDFYISKSKNLIIRSDSCERLIEERNNICSWKESLNKTYSAKAVKTCNRSKFGGYYLSVSSCLPGFIKENQSQKLYEDGANCWGTALSFYNVSKVPRFVWSEEISYWQSSPLCQKVSSKENLKTGDILNIYGPQYIFKRDETSKGSDFENVLYPNKFLAPSVDYGYSGYHNFLHSEIYISKNLSFGKNSPNKLDQFLFKKTNEIYGRTKDTDCLENQSLEPHLREYSNRPKKIKGSKCAYFSIAYRCKDFDHFIREQELTTENINDLIVIEDLKNIQKNIFKLQVLRSFSLLKYEIDRLAQLADRVSDTSLSELQNRHLTKVDEMLITMKFFTAAGIRKTLEQALLIPATEML